MPNGTSSSTLLGAAAEHFVMCQLLRQHMIAALAPAGVPDADIIVSDRLGSSLAAVQVKARRMLGSDGGWHMSKKHESMERPLLFYCFVEFGHEIADETKCWIIPSATVAKVLKVTHQVWLGQPGKSGKMHNDHDMRRLLPDYTRLGMAEFAQGWLDPFRNAWSQIANGASVG